MAVVLGLLIAVASVVAKHGFEGAQASVGPEIVAPELWSTGAVVVVHGLSCSVACGIFPDQGSNPYPPALAGRFLSLSQQSLGTFVF